MRNNFLFMLQLPDQTWTSSLEELQPNAASVQNCCHCWRIWWRYLTLNDM